MKCNCNTSENEGACSVDRNVIESMGRIHNLALDRISKLPRFPKESTKDSYTAIIKTWDEELRKFGIQTLFQSLGQLEKSSTEINKKLDLVIEDLFFEGRINFTEKKKHRLYSCAN